MENHLGKPTCRFCHGMEITEESGPFVKYGVSHYAHMRCFVESGKRLTLLTPKQFREVHRWMSTRKRGPSTNAQEE